MEKVSFLYRDMEKVSLLVITVKTEISLVLYLVHIYHLPKMKYIFEGNIRRRNIIRGTIRQANARSGIFPFGEMSFGELSLRKMFSGNSLLRKCLSAKCASGNCPRTVIPVYKSLELSDNYAKTTLISY